MNAGMVGAGLGGIAVGGLIGYGSTKMIRPGFEEQRNSVIAERTSAQAKLDDPNGRHTPTELDALRQSASQRVPSNPLGSLGWIAGATSVAVGGAVMAPRWSVDLSFKSTTTPAPPAAKLVGIGMALAGVALVAGSQVAAAQRRDAA